MPNANPSKDAPPGRLHTPNRGRDAPPGRLYHGVLLPTLLLIAGCSADPRPAVGPEAARLIAAMQEAYDRGDLQRALILADSASLEAPDLPEIDYYRGQVYVAMRRYEEAENAFRRTVELDDAYPGAWYQRGHNAFMQRKYREALGYYEEERNVLRAVSADALPTVTAQIGRTYAMLGVVDSARVAYEEALAGDSTLAVAHGWLSELLEDEGEVEPALQHAMQALRANPMEIQYGYQVGSLLFQMGRAGAAIPYLTTVARKWPGHEGAAFNLGRALQVEGRMEEAQVYLDRVEEIRDLQNKAMMAERGVETYPDDPQRWIDLAGYMMQMGYIDRAESALNTALALKPDDVSLQSDLANLAFARGDTAMAVYRYQAMLAQDSTFADGWLNLGVMYAMAGDREAARKAWQAALRHNPDDADARRYLQQLNQ